MDSKEVKEETTDEANADEKLTSDCEHWTILCGITLQIEQHMGLALKIIPAIPASHVVA